MPHHDADPPLMEVQVHDAVRHRPRDAPVGDLPHLEQNFVFVFVILFVICDLYLPHLYCAVLGG